MSAGKRDRNSIWPTWLNLLPSPQDLTNPQSGYSVTICQPQACPSCLLSLSHSCSTTRKSRVDSSFDLIVIRKQYILLHHQSLPLNGIWTLIPESFLSFITTIVRTQISSISPLNDCINILLVFLAWSHSPIQFSPNLDSF